MNKITQKIGRSFNNVMGLAQIPILIGVLLMAVAVPVATKMVQQQQDKRSQAAFWDDARRELAGHAIAFLQQRLTGLGEGVCYGVCDGNKVWCNATPSLSADDFQIQEFTLEQLGTEGLHIAVNLRTDAARRGGYISSCTSCRPSSRAYTVDARPRILGVTLPGVVLDITVPVAEGQSCVSFRDRIDEVRREVAGHALSYVQQKISGLGAGECFGACDGNSVWCNATPSLSASDIVIQPFTAEDLASGNLTITATLGTDLARRGGSIKTCSGCQVQNREFVLPGNSLLQSLGVNVKLIIPVATGRDCRTFGDIVAEGTRQVVGKAIALAQQRTAGLGPRECFGVCVNPSTAWCGLIPSLSADNITIAGFTAEDVASGVVRVTATFKDEAVSGGSVGGTNCSHAYRDFPLDEFTALGVRIQTTVRIPVATMDGRAASPTPTTTTRPTNTPSPTPVSLCERPGVSQECKPFTVNGCSDYSGTTYVYSPGSGACDTGQTCCAKTLRGTTPTITPSPTTARTPSLTPTTSGLRSCGQRGGACMPEYNCELSGGSPIYDVSDCDGSTTIICCMPASRSASPTPTTRPVATNTPRPFTCASIGKLPCHEIYNETIGCPAGQVKQCEKFGCNSNGAAGPTCPFESNENGSSRCGSCAPPPPAPTSPPSSMTCTWCTNRNQCIASCGESSWKGASTYCNVAGDGCCECPGQQPGTGGSSVRVTCPSYITSGSRTQIAIGQYPKKVDDGHCYYGSMNLYVKSGPRGGNLCTAQGFSKDNRVNSCTWDTTGFPAGTYTLESYYGGHSDPGCSDGQAWGSCTLQLVAPSPSPTVPQATPTAPVFSCNSLTLDGTAANKTITVGGSVRLSSVVSHYGIVSMAKVTEVGKLVVEGTNIQRVAQGNGTLNYTFTPTEPGIYVVETNAYESSQCNYLCSAGRVLYKNNVGPNRCVTPVGDWVRYGDSQCASIGCRRWIIVNTATVTPTPLPTCGTCDANTPCGYRCQQGGVTKVCRKVGTGAYQFYDTGVLQTNCANNHPQSDATCKADSGTGVTTYRCCLGTDFNPFVTTSQWMYRTTGCVTPTATPTPLPTCETCDANTPCGYRCQQDGVIKVCRKVGTGAYQFYETGVLQTRCANSHPQPNITCKADSGTGATTYVCCEGTDNNPFVTSSKWMYRTSGCIASTPTPTLRPTSTPVAGCSPIGSQVTTVRVGERIDFRIISNQALVCVSLGNVRGVSTPVFDGVDREAAGYVWRWHATANQAGRYVASFEGNNQDSGVGECNSRAIGTWCRQGVVEYEILPALPNVTPTVTIPVPTSTTRPVATVTPRPGCQTISANVQTVRVGQQVTFDLSSPQALVCVKLQNTAGVNGLSGVNVTREGSNWHWRWTANAQTAGTYTARFTGNNQDTGQGECDARAVGQWCEQNVNYTINPQPSVTPTPTVSRLPLTCSVRINGNSFTVGQPVIISASGGGAVGNYVARLWLENSTGTVIVPTPNGGLVAPNHNIGSCFPRTYSHVSSCAMALGGSCSTPNATVTNLPVGTYKIHCDVVELGGTTDTYEKCSGNPFCTYEGQGGSDDCTTPRLSGGAQCGKWSSCSGNDNATFVVVAPTVTPTSTVRPSPTPTVTVRPTATPTTDPGNATCWVNINKNNFAPGEGVVISATGNGLRGGEYDVRLWLEKTNFQRITPDPNGGMIRQTDFAPFPGDYYTEYRECRSTNGASCGTGSATITNLAVGQYYIHCDVIDRANPNRGKCSGNPACTYEGGTRDCSTVRDVGGQPWGGWVSCSGNDHTRFTILTVTATPTSTVRPSPTPTVTVRPTATATITPTYIPRNCNQACNDSTGYRCATGLTCGWYTDSDGVNRSHCRNPACPTDSDCVCGTSPTPTQTVAPTATVTPGAATVTPRPTNTPGAVCKSCPRDFKCYKKTWAGRTDEYKWFVSNYKMIGFNLVADSECVGRQVVKPDYKGKGVGDANCDGFVDGSDYSIWRKEFVDMAQGGATNPFNGNAESDFNCDGVVNGVDYSIWRTTYIDSRGEN